MLQVSFGSCLNSVDSIDCSVHVTNVEFLHGVRNLGAYQLLLIFIAYFSCGGNILINVGPTADGMIIPVYEERLRQLGSWLQVNGEAIYASKPWKYQNDTVTPAVW